MKSARSERPRILLVNRSVVLHPKDRKFLIIQRTKSDWKGSQWETPGGKLDEGQDIADAVEREIFEETQLVVNPINRMAYFESFVMSQGKYKGLTYIGITGISKAVNSTVKLSEEHDDFKWINFKEIDKYEFTMESKKALISLQELIEKQF